MDAKPGADYRVFKNALSNLLQQPKLIQQLKSQEGAGDAMKALKFQSEDVRTDLIILLNQIDEYSLQNRAGPTAPAPPAAEKTVSPNEINSAKVFFERAFEQLQRAYKTSVFMSLTMFVMGVGFLILAAYQAVYRPDNIKVASVVGGIGVIQIVALFYRNPLADIARAVSNAQQAKLAITSYLIGITLIHQSIGLNPPAEWHLQSLLQVTDKVLRQLQEYTEDHKVSERIEYEKQNLS
jgi:hypothetical protein